MENEATLNLESIDQGEGSTFNLDKIRELEQFKERITLICNSLIDSFTTTKFLFISDEDNTRTRNTPVKLFPKIKQFLEDSVNWTYQEAAFLESLYEETSIIIKEDAAFRRKEIEKRPDISTFSYVVNKEQIPNFKNRLILPQYAPGENLDDLNELFASCEIDEHELVDGIYVDNRYLETLNFFLQKITGKGCNDMKYKPFLDIFKALQQALKLTETYKIQISNIQKTIIKDIDYNIQTLRHGLEIVDESNMSLKHVLSTLPKVYPYVCNTDIGTYLTESK